MAMQIPRGITEKANGKYAIQGMLAGERLNGTATCLEDAIRIKTQMKAGIYKMVATSASITIAEALASHIKRRVAASTSEQMTAQKFKWYSKTITDFFGATTKLDSVSVAQVHLFQDDMADRDFANTTINYMGSILYNAMLDAHQRGQMTTEPTRMKTLQAENGRIRFLSLDEEFSVTSWFQQNGHDTYKDLVLFYIETGLRKSEALNLKWCDVDLKRKRISIWRTKSNFPRSISMTPMVVEILQRLQMSKHNSARHDDKIFGHISVRNFGRTWGAMRTALGLQNDEEFVLHALRHTCCTRMVEAGTDLRTVMEWMGHSSLEITQRYSHFIPKRMDDAVGRLVSLRAGQL